MDLIKSMVKIERELILSDTLMCVFLQVEADKVGVSLEEYVDKFLEVFHNVQSKLPVLDP